jgi:hypothetical protein
MEEVKLFTPKATAAISRQQFRSSSTLASKGTSLVVFELTRYECAKYVELAASSAYACVIAVPTGIAHHMEMSLLVYSC